MTKIWVENGIDVNPAWNNHIAFSHDNTTWQTINKSGIGVYLKIVNKNTSSPIAKKSLSYTILLRHASTPNVSPALEFDLADVQGHAGWLNTSAGLNVAIAEITDWLGDGTWTITYTDATTQIIDTPGSVPNDAWVTLDYSDMTAVAFTGSATYDQPKHGTPSIDLEYKIIAEDTVIVKGLISRTVDITGLSNSVNQNFRFAPFGTSNWFSGTKIFVPTTQRVPITIYTNTSTDLPNQKGCAIISTASSENLISIGETNLQLPNGRYTVNIHFEVVCEIV